MPRFKELDLDEFLERLQNPKVGKKKVRMTEDEVNQLCCIVIESFRQQDTLVNIKAPLQICGDTHGQYFDLLKLFRIGGSPEISRYLFLGDYVDRGKNSLETICLLLALKCKYPESFYLLRGNHECAPINKRYGFLSEIKRRFKQGNFMNTYLKLNTTFNHMPIAAIVDGKVYCCHGGISPLLVNVKDIIKIKRPIPPPKAGLVSDILWSDPDETIEDWEKQNRPDINPKHRGIGYLWGSVSHAKFLKKNKLKMIIRAHECVENGYRWSFGKQLVTVFSAPNYSEDNYAAIATYHCDGTVSFATFK